MGSDMSYEDLSNRELNENEYKRLEDETVNGIECYVLEIIPKKEAKSSYTKHIHG
jgi:outer membrane lipoprotein-sorting protein